MTDPKPVRLQRRRTEGFRLVSPNGRTVKCVDRSSVWGNPYRADMFGLAMALLLYGETVRGCWNPKHVANLSDELASLAYGLHQDWLAKFRASRHCSPMDEIRHDLRRFDLACYCAICPRHAATGKPLDESCPDCKPCHVDVLGEILYPKGKD